MFADKSKSSTHNYESLHQPANDQNNQSWCLVQHFVLTTACTPLKPLANSSWSADFYEVTTVSPNWCDWTLRKRLHQVKYRYKWLSIEVTRSVGLLKPWLDFKTFAKRNKLTEQPFITKTLKACVCWTQICVLVDVAKNSCAV